MIKIKSLFVILLSLTFSSCATIALWEATDPDVYVKISFSEIDEQELIEKKICFKKSQTAQAFFVEKDSFAKLEDYSLRVLLTPITVVVDAGIIILVSYIGGVHGNIYYNVPVKAERCEDYSDCTK